MNARSQMDHRDRVGWMLCAGLVLHKVVWVVLARRSGTSSQSGEGMPLVHVQRSPLKRLMKLAKVAFLAFLGVQALFLRVWPIASRGSHRAIGMMIYLLGLATAIAGRLELGRNWANIEDAQVLTRQCVVTTGIYRLIRHPIYAGDGLLLIGFQLALNSWLVLAMLIPLGVFVRQALAEEALLTASLPGYEAYRARTRRFIPFVV